MTLCASPLSAASSTSFHKRLQKAIVATTTTATTRRTTTCVGTYKGGPKRRMVTLWFPGKNFGVVLRRCYGNADFSDCIGRTLSFVLMARLALSFFFATLLVDEEQESSVIARDFSAYEM